MSMIRAVEYSFEIFYLPVPSITTNKSENIGGALADVLYEELALYLV